MRYDVIPFIPAHADEAARLLAEAHARECAVSPLLPPLDPCRAARFVNECGGGTEGPAVAAFHLGRMVGFLRTTSRFPWKGQLASVSREYAHAATGGDRGLIYQLMYAAVAEEWVAAGSQLHILCHFAGDPVVRETIYRLGFGAIIAENLRDLSPVAGVTGAATVEECDPAAVGALALEHARYYRGSPIFVWKGDDAASELAGLEEGSRAGNAVFAYRERGEPAAYFVVGPCGGEEEGRLLRDTNTAQIMSAYSKPETRGRLIGAALLDRCAEWARLRGHERLFVEHETANILGAAFWGRHFSPYLYASMRYVESAP
jgi:GNAT superfamily N-acetyltransferase